ncbi:MAG: TldD/PmbA family protein, partial [Proteobacteria bacterium]|nr:TldD/PmbA family protein [Pseudomonadota bacterium]
MTDNLTLAARAVKRGQELGAEEVAAAFSESTQTTITRRNRKIEQATQSTTAGLGASLLVDQRYSSHGTSDLRPEALDEFLQQAVAATRFLEPDECRGQADIELCGRGSSPEQLDQDDPHWYERTSKDRAQFALELEEALLELHADDVISSSVFVADGASTSYRVMSNGFTGENQGAWYAMGGDMTLDDGEGKRPEAAAYFTARYFTDLPAPAEVAAEIARRARERIGSIATSTGAYPMILANRCAGRIVSALGGPMSGDALHENRSCLTDRLGTKIGSDLFTLIDDPTIPRGLGSRPWDGDTLVAKPRTIVKNGILESYNISVYYSRKLKVDPTSGGRSNWVIPPGTRSAKEITQGLPKAILVTGFLGGNSNAATGDFSLGIRGVLLEN